MAKRKRYGAKSRKSRKSRKTFRRSRRRTFQAMGVPSGAPTQRRAVLRYSSLMSLTSTLGSIGHQSIRANGCFDPENSVGGHQPGSWDVWTQLYNQYTVMGSKMRVYVVDENNVPGFTGTYLSHSSAIPYPSINSYIEAKHGTWKPMTAQNTRPVVTGSRFSARKFFNVKDPKDNMEHLGAAVTADPVESANFIAWYATSNGTTNTVQIQVVIDYIVDFSEPKVMVAS